MLREGWERQRPAIWRGLQRTARPRQMPEAFGEGHAHIF